MRLLKCMCGRMRQGGYRVCSRCTKAIEASRSTPRVCRAETYSGMFEGHDARLLLLAERADKLLPLFPLAAKDVAEAQRRIGRVYPPPARQMIRLDEDDVTNDSEQLFEGVQRVERNET